VPARCRPRHDRRPWCARRTRPTIWSTSNQGQGGSAVPPTAGEASRPDPPDGTKPSSCLQLPASCRRSMGLWSMALARPGRPVKWRPFRFLSGVPHPARSAPRGWQPTPATSNRPPNRTEAKLPPIHHPSFLPALEAESDTDRSFGLRSPQLQIPFFSGTGPATPHKNSLSWQWQARPLKHPSEVLI
jgi:hypothetical protein